MVGEPGRVVLFHPVACTYSTLGRSTYDDGGRCTRCNCENIVIWRAVWRHRAVQGCNVVRICINRVTELASRPAVVASIVYNC